MGTTNLGISALQATVPFCGGREREITAWYLFSPLRFSPQFLTGGFSYSAGTTARWLVFTFEWGIESSVLGWVNPPL